MSALTSALSQSNQDVWRHKWTSIPHQLPSPDIERDLDIDAEPVDDVTCEGDVSLPKRPGFCSFFIIFSLLTNEFLY